MELKKMELTSASGHDINLEALYQIMPSAFTEVCNEKTGEISHKINFDTMRELLGDNAYEGADEEYGFKWVGKNAARREAARPINKTLRPCPEESVDWENTQNLYIEGDNLEVLKLLQKSYLGKINMIYIDPPYNTGNDFVYRDDFAIGSEEYDLQSGNVNDLGVRFRKNTETEAKGRFHSNWCSMIYERLLVSRALLSNNGVIFISIDDNEVANLKEICDEIFGSSNFIDIFNWAKTETPENLSKKSKQIIEYVLCYQKNKDSNKFKGVKKTSVSSNGLLNQPNKFKSLIFPANIVKTSIPNGIIKAGKYGTDSYEVNLLEDTEVKDGLFSKPIVLEAKFKWSQENLEAEIANGTEIKIPTMKFSPSYEKKEYDAEVPANLINSKVGVYTNEVAGSYIESLFGKKVFSFPKPTSLIEYLFGFNESEEESLIVMDFFSGSATSADAVMRLNANRKSNKYKYILVQLPEDLITAKDNATTESAKQIAQNAIDFCTELNLPLNLCSIAKERIRRAGKKIKEEANLEAQNLDTGFRVFKCDDSNMQDVYFTPSDYSQDLLSGLIDNVKDERNDLDLLFGCMLDWGVQLSLPLSNIEVNGKKIHIVNDGDLVACFEKDIDEEIISAIAEQLPLRVVFRDSCFSDAPLKMNLFEIFKQKCGWSEEIVKNRVHVI